MSSLLPGAVSALSLPLEEHCTKKNIDYIVEIRHYIVSLYQEKNLTPCCRDTLVEGSAVGAGWMSPTEDSSGCCTIHKSGCPQMPLLDYLFL